ncbi:MAG: pantetheine-phosphate adenylyltransferase [Bacilli bacterium]|jgi:pantetheine-phosphate adenylyltransferase|nr:pantetheine-phosphate adenylyltransferase [Bacilli bacterium]MDD3389360.1 pantetheine-phosphate adenylyltransferase [Bacilli bacterium]MDD4344872.1 pantetheine-phosphate adenylyltransferase [Bacilli bacterium]MDD4521252.1 pantetheine-phosphate adenylyltransferase [Bacilli bacterium]MDY0399898.1 pantetheine-phosphate adenylyltransferase [Bacilli bacterium]
MKRIAVYPGSFDPITNGHMDILKRALDIFDEVIILVAIAADKKTFFTIDERVEMIREATKSMPHVSVDATKGLSVHYAKKHQATALVRGLRAVSDFEYEFKLAAGNNYVDPDIEVVFFMAKSQYNFLASSTLKELYIEGVDISPLVPASVIGALKKKHK